MEKNVRTYPRAEISLPVHYKYFEKGAIFHALMAQAKNIGAKGLAMFNDRWIADGQNLLLTLFLPPENARAGSAPRMVLSENEGLPVIILSKVAWCRSLGSGAYTAGVEFLIPDPHHHLRFRKFLEDLRINQPAAYADLPERTDENEP